MSLKSLGILCCIYVCSLAQNWRGNLETYQVWTTTTCQRCVCRYWWGCGQWRDFTCSVLIDYLRCARGWKHGGDYNCIIPICLPNCGPGVCTRPDTCDCRNLAIGQYCQTLTCSYQRPCYPGNCYENSKCNCTVGFEKESLSVYGSEYGCLKISPTKKPTIGKSTIIITHIRRTDNKFLYNFLLDGTNNTSVNQLTVWSNQRIFNEMAFEFEARFESEPLPERPDYVHSTNVGIVDANVRLRVLNFGGVEHQVQKYDFQCPAARSSTIKTNPPTLFNCSIEGEEFKTLVEHADTLVVTFEARNGGSRRLINGLNFQPYEYFDGQTATKQVFFKFDFQVAKNCKEAGFDATYTPTDCENATILNIDNEFTKSPIKVQWKGWTDDRYGSQMWMYYLELHKLVTKDVTRELTELNPIKPMSSKELMHIGPVLHQTEFTPTEPGMYSILLEVRDIANNSRIARRLVLYDPSSDVEVSVDQSTSLHISSAVKETNYLWQTKGVEGGIATINVAWTGYFKNKLHEELYLLNLVREFPVQFQDLEDGGNGILSSKKFVDPKLDDVEGKRQLDGIPNIHGIVKFEYQFSKNIIFTDPPGTWNLTTSLSETQTITETMRSGDQLKIWVRATDIMGNQKIASTYVTMDFSPPKISQPDNNETTHLEKNVPDPTGTYNYSSRLKLYAVDEESGVRQIGLGFEIHIPNKPDKIVTKMVPANTDLTRHPDRDPLCVLSKDKSTCFLANQTLFFDNCWLMLSDKDYLSSASVTVNVLVYNQAMLSSSLTFQIPRLSDLSGLQQYSGPENIRIENIQANSFRVKWDQPKVKSCYSLANIIIALFVISGSGEEQVVTQTVPGTSTYFDFGSLDPEMDYRVQFTTVGTSEPLQLEAKLEAKTRRLGNTTCDSVTNLIIGDTRTCEQVFSAVVTCLSGICKCSEGYVANVKRNACEKECQKDQDYVGTYWNRSSPGQEITINCPEGFTGSVSRFCDVNGVYQPPVYNCTRTELTSILTEVTNNTAFDVTSILARLATATSDNSKSNGTLLIGDLDAVNDVIIKVTDVIDENSTQTLFNLADSFFDVANNLLEENTASTWVIKINKTGEGVNKLLDNVDRFIAKIVNIANASNNTSMQFTKSKPNLYLKVGSTASCVNSVRFPDRNDTEIPEWAANTLDSVEVPCSTNDKARAYSSVFYRNISNSIPLKTSSTYKTVPMKLDAPVISFSFLPKDDSKKLETAIQLTFQLFSKSMVDPVCSFWTKRNSSGSGYWSSDGCWLENYNKVEGIVVCKCDHLTNFAVLTSPSSIPLGKDRSVLSIISMVGCIISMAALFITFIVHIFYWRIISGFAKRKVNSERTILNVNLCCILFVAYLVFLTGIEQTVNKGMCTVVAVLLHFVYLAAFFIMLVEGLYLAYMVFKPLSKRKPGKPLIIAAYVIATAIVAVSAGSVQLDGYGTSTYCWLSTETGIIWAFIGPVILIVCINIIIVAAVIWKMFGTTSMSKKTNKERAKVGLRSVIVLMPLVGVTWLFGVFSINADTILFQYLFAILNSLQGFLFFTFHCCMDRKIREAFRTTRFGKWARFILFSSEAGPSKSQT